MNELWSQFPRDPRDPAQAGMRASDQDRELVLGALGDAYADGRLTRDELDERTDAVTTARTLGELPPLIADLVPDSAPVPRGSVPVPAVGLRDRAVEKWRHDRREAAWGAISVSVICLVIWGVTGQGFFWPAFVMLASGLNVGRIVVMREDLIAEETRRLERKAEKNRRKALPPPESDERED